MNRHDTRKIGPLATVGGPAIVVAVVVRTVILGTGIKWSCGIRNAIRLGSNSATCDPAAVRSAGIRPSRKASSSSMAARENSTVSSSALVIHTLNIAPLLSSRLVKRPPVAGASPR